MSKSAPAKGKAAAERADRQRRAMKAVMAAAGFNSVNSWATTAGVSEGGIRAFFKGTVNSLNISTLEKLAAAAGRSVSALLGDSDAEAGEGSPRRGAGPAPNFALIPEILVTAGMGGGEIQEVETFGQDTVRDTWGLPRDFIREGRTQPENLRILPLKGDSMAPTLIGTDRAIIDIADRIPSPPGIFALWDGYGVIVKRVEIVPKTRPPRLRVISDNQMHQPYEIEGEEHTIIGRLRGLIRWL